MQVVDSHTSSGSFECLAENKHTMDSEPDITTLPYENHYLDEEWVILEISKTLIIDTKLQMSCDPNTMKDILESSTEDKEYVNIEPYPNVSVLAELALAVYTNRCIDNTDIQYEAKLKLPEGWKLLVFACNQEKNNGYFAIAVWNPLLHHIVISHKGNCLQRDEWTKIFGEINNKYVPRVQSAITFVNTVINVINQVNANNKYGKRFEYRLSLTGHSIGAWLAQITALSAEYLEAQESVIIMRRIGGDTLEPLRAHTVVFESPGCKHVLKNIQNDFLKRFNIKIDLRKLDITSYQSAPNRTNNYKLHVGTLYRIMSVTEKSEFHKTFNSAQVFKQKHTIHEILDWPFNKESITTNSAKYSEGHYKARLCKGNYCNVSIFTNKEIKVLEIWNILKKFGCDFINLKEYAKMFGVEDPNELVPAFNLKRDRIECKTKVDLEYIIKRVKQLIRWYSKEIMMALKDHLSKTPASAREMFRIESEKYIGSLPECDINFRDTASIEAFLKSEQQYLIVSSEDSHFEMVRCFNILKQMEESTPDNVSVSKYIGNNHQCFFDMEQFMHLYNNNDVNTFMKSENSFNLLIIKYDSQSPNASEDNFSLLKERLNFMSELREKKVIFVALSQFTACIKLIESHRNAIREMIMEPLSFMDLTDESQSIIIAKHSIILSGKELSLKDFTGRCKSNYKDILNNLLDSHDLKRIILNKSVVFNLGNAQNMYDLEVLLAKFDNYISQQNLIDYFTNLKSSNSNPNIVISGVRGELMDSKWTQLESSARIKDVRIVTIESVESGEGLFKEMCRMDPHSIWYWLEQAQSSTWIKFKQAYNLDFYINRKCSHQKVINGKIINYIESKQKNNAFIFQDVVDAELLNRLSIIPHVKILSRHAENFDTFLEENFYKNIHFLSAANYSPTDDRSHFMWLRSMGNLDVLRQYANISENNYNEPIGEQQLYDKKLKVIVMIDEFSTGKSTSLVNLSELMMSSWVMHFNLKTMQIPVTELPSNPDTEDIVKFLLPKHFPSLAARLLKFCLENEQSRHVYLLFDGFDELQEEVRGKLRWKVVQEKFMKILKFLRDKTTASIVVTARKYPNEMLENELSVFATKFEKITKYEQIQFFVRFWRANIMLQVPNYAEYEEKSLQKLAEMLYANAERHLDSDVVDFMGIPLQMRMLAEAYFPKVKQHMGLPAARPQQPIKVDTITDLYETFINVKYDIYLNDKCGLNDSPEVIKLWLTNKLTKAHEIFSFWQMIPNANAYLENDLKKDEILEINRVGLIQLSANGRNIELVHQTFAEYFTANLIIKYLSTSTDWKQIILSQVHKHAIEDLLLTKILLEDKFKIVRSFINDKLVDIFLSPNEFKLKTLSIDRLWTKQALIYNENYQTILHLAIQERFHGILQYILSNLNSQTSLGCYLSFITARDLQDNTAWYIVTKDKVISHGKLSEYLSRCSAQIQHSIILSSIIKIIDEENEGYNFLLNYYLEHREGINSVIEGRETITALIELFHNSIKGNNDLKALEQIVDAVPYNLERQYFLESKYGKSSNTVLHSAVKESRYEIVEYLLTKCDVQIDTMDNEGKTALQYAVILKPNKNPLPIVKLLLKSGADATHRDMYDMSTLAWCARDGCKEVLEYLLTFSLESGVDINSPDRNEISPVQHAAKSGNLDHVKILINKGADYSHQDRFGYTALSWAAHKGQLPVIKYLHEEKGCDIDSLNRYNMSVLLIAIKFNHSKVAEYLIKKHADINKEDWNGVTPLHMARRAGMKSIVNLLVSFGAH